MPQNTNKQKKTLVSGGEGFLKLFQSEKGILKDSFDVSETSLSDRVSKARKEAFLKVADFDPSLAELGFKLIRMSVDGKLVNSIKTKVQDDLFSFEIESEGTLKPTKETKEIMNQKTNKNKVENTSEKVLKVVSFSDEELKNAY
tara:strand:- start:568 stop:999 length:432 start_codon:yes stop_codon:yes gene_type:complete